MPSAVERRLDAHLARTLNQVRRMRQFDLSRKAECEEALKESMEVLQALTMYRGMLKNISEQQAPPTPPSPASSPEYRLLIDHRE